MKKRKKRSIAASRAASLKSWRTRQRMKEARVELTKPLPWEWKLPDEDYRKPTIDLIPKVTWP